ncbi:MAG: tRNA (adenosine(37)-N6)-threonylcarbamoyltransferase complex transferase subunit TsaD [Clostridiales bacterium]
MEDILILSVETSCDDTSIAVVKNGKIILSNVISSQTDLHVEFGGVVPEIASRKHLEYIVPVIDEALKSAKVSFDDISAIGVTYGPGLVGALIVGISAAKSIALSIDKPLIGVNHIEGHIAANFIENDIKFPFICLVVSGGHSHIVYVENHDTYKIMGRTRDDAAGEAFDKIARAIGLGYPGGPAIDKKAKEGNSEAIKFPRVYFKDSYDFSFSGLKTSVLNYINKMKQNNMDISIEDVSASFQKAVVDVLVSNSIKAAIDNKVSYLAIAGGVASNSLLRSNLKKEAAEKNIRFFYPKPVYCTDNAAMIGCAAYYKFVNNKTSEFDLNAVPGLKLGK